MEDREAKAERDDSIPESAEEIRRRRLEYFENANKLTAADRVHSTEKVDSTGKPSKKVHAEATGSRSTERQTAFDVSEKHRGRKTTEFHVQANSTKSSTKTSSSNTTPSGRPKEVVSYKSYSISEKTVETIGSRTAGKTRRRGSTSSVSDEDAVHSALNKPAQPVIKPSQSGGTPKFSHTAADSGKVFEERTHRVTRNVGLSGDSEVENLFSNHRRTSANEIPALSLKDSVDDAVSVFKSSANFNDLGLSTHRPESNISSYDLTDRRRMTRQRSMSSENLLLGTKVEEIRSVLGEQKYREFIEKSERDLSELHAQKFHDRQSASSFLVNGDVRQERLSRRDSPSRNTPTPPPQPPSPSLVSSSKRGPSPRRRLRSSSPQMVSHTLQDVARHNQARDASASRNYEQVVVPHKTTFSTDEIYKQAYGGSTSDRSTSSDVRKSSGGGSEVRKSIGSLSSSYHESSAPFWSSVTPRQMGGLISPTSTHVPSMYAFSPVSAAGPMHPAAQMHHPVYHNANNSPAYRYPQGIPMSPGAGGQYMYPMQQSMFMPVSSGTPPSPDPFMYHHGHPLSHSMPAFHGGDMSSPVGSPWQQFTQYPPPNWGQYVASAERNNSYSGPPNWQESSMPMMVPQPPGTSPGRGRESHDSRQFDNRANADHTAQHAEAVRQHHESFRQQYQERRGSHSGQNASDFSTSSVERYFASLGMGPPPYPPPPYHLHPPKNPPQESKITPQERHHGSRNNDETSRNMDELSGDHRSEHDQHHQRVSRNMNEKSGVQRSEHFHPHQAESRSASALSGIHQSEDVYLQIGRRQEGEAPVDRASDSDDNLTTVTGASIATGTSIRPGGITERMEDLGVDPVVLRQLKQQTDKSAADEKTLEAMRTMVRICPECEAVNKEYMTWCLQCGGVLIGVEPILARNLKKKNKEKSSKTEARSSHKKKQTRSEPYIFTADTVEPWTDVAEEENENEDEFLAERFKHGAYIEEEIPAQHTEGKNFHHAAEEDIEEEEIPDTKESPESGKGPSATSSPARKIGSRDNTEDSEDLLEMVENKDSGRPSSGEGPDARKPHTQPSANYSVNAADSHPTASQSDGNQPHLQEGQARRTQKEISDICEVISDPIIRGFIKNYLQKRPGEEDNFISGNNLPGGKAVPAPNQQPRPPSKQNEVSNSLALDLSASISSTAPPAKAIQSQSSPTKKKSQRKNSKGKGHEALDVEIFGIEEARLCRSARSGANLVPMLNLVHSSDEEDDSSDKTGSVSQGAGAGENNDASSWHEIDEAEHQPVNYDKELRAITENSGANPIEIPVQHIGETVENFGENFEGSPANIAEAGGSSGEEGGKFGEVGANRAMFLQQLVDNASTVGPLSPSPPSTQYSGGQNGAKRTNASSPQQSEKSSQPRPPQRKQSPVSKVRASIDAPPQNRRWARSSIAWSSYHPRELSTRSSLNLSRGGGGRGSSANVRASRSTDNLANSSSTDFLPSQRQRPASADQHNRKMAQQSRPFSAGRGGRPYSAQVPPPVQSWQQVESQDSVGDVQRPSERYRQRGSSDHGTIESPRFPESADHRLPVQEMTLPLIPTGPSTALQIYDRCTELTPRIEEGALSKWLCLPDELWLHVFSYLPQTDLFRAALTCKQLYRIALDDTLWKYLTVKKKTLKAEWLTQVAHRHPVSLALVQCHGENINSDALRELFREIAPALKELNFSRCSRGVLTGDNILLHASARCRNLTHVDASWCHVTDNGLSALAECCHRLESLCLNGCQMITDESLEAVLKKHGQSLRVLELFGCFGLTQSGFRSLATYCTFLLTLNIGQCHKVTDSCVATLSASLGRVENLDLRGCKQIKDNCIRKIVRNCPRLRMLTLANCPSISDSAIVEIATYSADIRVLDVCGCRGVSDSGIRTLANNCGRLTSIDISSTSCTHKSALTLASCSRCLECAKFNFLPDISESCLLKLIKSCKRLNTIHLYGCNNIRDVSRLKMLNRFLHIEM